MLAALRGAPSPAIEREPLGSAEWVPLAHAEGPEAAGLASPERGSMVLSREKLHAAAANYNPRKHRAPIIRASSGRLMDAHDQFRGRSRGKPSVLGFVHDVRMNGDTLEGKLHEIADRCDACRGDDPNCPSCKGTGYAGRLSGAMTEGHVRRSVHIQDNPQFGGPYPLHVAVGYDGEGQLGLPPLSDGISGLDRQAARAYLQLAAGEEFACRAMPGSGEPATAPKEKTVEDQDLKRISEEAAKAAKAAAEEAVRGLVTEAVTSALTAALPAALKPVSDAVAASQEAVRAMQARADDAALAERVDDLVEDGRLPPAERDGTLEAVRGMAPEPREKYLKVLEARQSRLGGRGERFVGAVPPEALRGPATDQVDFGVAAPYGESFAAESATAYVEAARGLAAANGGKKPTPDEVVAELRRTFPDPRALWN